MRRARAYPTLSVECGLPAQHCERDFGQQSHYSLTPSTFQTQLEEVPSDTKVLLEFYAHWCPACQRFSPEYEHLAAVLNAEPKPEPKVLVARVDCAEEVRSFLS